MLSRSTRNWPPPLRALALALAGCVVLGCGARTYMDLPDPGDAGITNEGGADGATDAIADIVYDHVNDINGCNPATCSGCCDDNGVCRAGVDSMVRLERTELPELRCAEPHLQQRPVHRNPDVSTAI